MMRNTNQPRNNPAHSSAAFKGLGPPTWLTAQPLEIHISILEPRPCRYASSSVAAGSLVILMNSDIYWNENDISRIRRRRMNVRGVVSWLVGCRDG